MERHAYFDNAKFFLIYLVVFGHLIQPRIEELNTIYVLYTWIYFFHMPAFIFLAGFFAKGAGDKGYIGKLTKKLLLPYLVFQLIYTVYFFFIGKEDWVATPFHPHWSLWFLFSLFFWHLLLAAFKKIPAVAGICFAVIIGIAVGYVEQIGHTFSLSRTVVFFPFFLLGFWLKKEHLFMLKKTPIKIMAVLFLLAMIAIITVLPSFSADWLMNAKSYEELGQPVYGGIFRLGIYSTAVLMSICVFAWIPKQESIFSKLGQRTMYVYLLHGFFIHFFREADLFKINHPIDTIGLAAIAFLITLLLSTKVILGLWQPLIEGRTIVLRRLWSRIRQREITNRYFH